MVNNSNFDTTRRRVRFFMFFAWLCKLIGNSGLRVLYPLAPFLGEDWNFSNSEIAIVLSVGEFAGAAAVLIAPFADHYGTTWITIYSWLIASFSTLLLVVPSFFWSIILLRVSFNLFYTVFQITVQSIAMTVISQEHKGWATGILESSWSLSALIVVPIVSVVYGATSDEAIFAGMGCLMVFCTIGLFYTLPRSTKEPNLDQVEKPRKSKTVMKTLSGVFTPAATLFNLQALFLAAPHNAVFTMFGFWAKDEFGISVEEVGGSLFAIGAAELFGVFCVSFLTPRLYKWNLSIYNSLYTANFLFCLFLILFNFTSSYAAGLAMLVLFYIPGEYLIVLTISEAESFVQPEFRTTMLALHFTSGFIGRALGALFGEKLYSSGGITLVVIVGVCFILLSGLTLFIARWLKLAHDKVVVDIKVDASNIVLEEEIKQLPVDTVALK